MKVDVLDIQIGRKEPEPAPEDSLRPDHKDRYTSVLIHGFSKTAEEQDIYDILLEGVFHLITVLKISRRMTRMASFQLTLWILLSALA